MDVKYSKLSQSDPEKGNGAFDFKSIFTYEYPKYFSYGGPSNKYRSGFTYAGGFDPNFQKPAAIEYEKPSKAMHVFAAVVTIICYILMGLTFPISWWFCHKKIPQYERLVVFRIGRLLSTKGPGMIVILPCIDKFKRVDLRLKAFSVPPQTVMTTDGGSIEMGAEVYHHVKDPVLVVNNVQDVNHSIRVIAQAALQKCLNKYCIPDIEASKAAISKTILDSLNHTSLTWGVECTKVDLSAMKVLMQPNPALSSQPNPMEVLGQMLFPQGDSGPTSGIHGMDPAGMFGQLASHFQMGGTGLEVKPQKTDQSIAELVQISSGAMEQKSQKKTGKKFKNAFELLEVIQPHLKHSLVQEFRTVYKFVVTGKDGGTFHLDLKNGSGSASLGEPPIGVPDVTLTLSSVTLKQLLNEQTTPFGAYMSGSLGVEGDTNTASKLSELIEIINK